MSELRPILRDLPRPPSIEPGPAPMLQWIDIELLVVDESYQRELRADNMKAIRRIAERFDWSKFSTVHVAPIEGGRFAIIDGQHRTHAAAACGFSQVPCQVTPMDRTRQAAAFAAINGLAVTGGFEITLCCDMVIAAETAWFRDTHAKIGLLPGWGLSQRLPRVAGAYRAKEISLTARKVGAEEAARLGFVNRVVPDAELVPEALSLAREVARWPRAGTRNIKALIDGGLALPLGEALAFESRFAMESNREVTLAAEGSTGKGEGT